jgi:hypothetical protein
VGVEPRRRLVDLDHPRVDAPGELERQLEIGGVDGGRQAERRGVDKRGRLVGVAGVEHDQHRPEKLLAGDGIRGVDAVEHGRVEVAPCARGARRAAAREHAHAPLDRCGYRRLEARLVGLVDQRADVRLRVVGRADAELRDALEQRGHRPLAGPRP